MFPAETSLIPATVALVRFYIENGFLVFFHNYPFWYLGSTPYKFLIGPVVPIVTGFIRILLPNVSLFNILIYLIVLSFIISAVGWGMLVKKITNNKILTFLMVFIFLILPGKYFTAFGLEEATYVIARNLLPFLFLFILEKKKITSILFLSLILLINTSILTQSLVGIGAISLNLKSFKKNLSLILYSLIIVTFWYTPTYWITILFNPSIGGLSLGKLFLRVFELVRSLLPVLFAFFVVRLGKVKRPILERFALIWFGVFIFLTFYRFVADYDFWSDWTAWLPELEIGFTILFAYYYQTKSYKNIFYIILIIFLPTYVITKNISLKSLITSSPPKYMQNIDKLNTLSNGKNVFLSGSSVFWANAFYNIYQVRGGKDQVSIHKTWDKASYEFREGNDAEKTFTWLKNLNIQYVLIHTNKSQEYYKDFQNIYKWDNVGKIVWQENGDFIIKTF
jgi:hypothetical protein